MRALEAKALVADIQQNGGKKLIDVISCECCGQTIEYKRDMVFELLNMDVLRLDNEQYLVRGDVSIR